MKKPRIGLIARMDRTGLGYQTKALFDLLKPEKTLVVNSTPFNNNAQIPEWYHLPQDLSKPQDRFVAYTLGMNDDLAFDWLVYGLDVIVTCEVPYHDKLYEMARKRGIKVILQPNAELNPHFTQPSLDKPDYFFLPSTWYKDETLQLGVPTVVCPPPIAMQPANNPVFKDHGVLKVLHIAGKKALADRNGTEIVEKVVKDIPGIELTIRSQAENNVPIQSDLYKGGFHVMLMPRRYGGLCMPMLEALSQGMPVLMTDIEPNRTVLPEDWLLKTDFHSTIKTKRLITSYATSHNAIHSALERFKNMDQLQYDEERSKARAVFADHQKAVQRWEFYINRIVEGKEL